MKKCFCCNDILNLKYRDNKVKIFECVCCRSLKIYHEEFSTEKINKDYYLNQFYDQKDLKKSMQKTRYRQASKIISIVSKFVNKNSIIIDYGCGRGIFLKEALKSGFENLIGVETSEKVIKELEYNFSMIKVDIKKGDLVFNKKFEKILPESQTILFALDVIEHFPTDKLYEWLEKCIKNFASPSLIFVKVPARNGLMFKISFLLANLNIINSPLHQLLQVGTFPPHFSYFSESGIKQIFRKLGYKNIFLDGDLEYDIFCLSSRMGLKGVKKYFIDFMISPIFGLLSNLFRSKDSNIFVFKRVE